MAGTNQKKDGDWGSWTLIVFLFAIGLWPVALILLFTKLFAPDRQSRAGTPPPRANIPYKMETQPGGAENRAKNAAKKMVQSPVAKKSNAALLKILGIIFAVMGLLGAAGPAGDVLAGNSAYLSDLFRSLAGFVAGAGMLGGGVSMDRSMKRYARYLVVMGDAEAMAFSQLAAKLGLPEKKVIKDLQKMIEKGFFGGKAYLNMELGCFFRSGQADAELERLRREQQAAQTPQEAEAGYSGILRNIRRANDAIADPVLTEKITRLEEITEKIFKAVEEDPKKQGKIDTFLNYYLPTTQKLLDAYAEFESAGVEGENLRQAKERIQSTMDAIVAGFEHQLDELYKADAMDVDSDIRVMETMLNRDTASVERDFGLGKKTGNSAEAGGKRGKTADLNLGGMAAQREEE